MPVKVKKVIRKSQAQFREKLRKLRLMQNDSFLIKSACICCKHHYLTRIFGPVISIIFFHLLVKGPHSMHFQDCEDV